MILTILNRYKNTLEDLIDSSDIKLLAIPRQTDLPSNDIPGSKDNPSDSKVNDDLLNRL